MSKLISMRLYIFTIDMYDNKKQCFQLFLDWTRTLVSCAGFFRTRSSVQVKLCALKFGRYEVNFSRPENVTELVIWPKLNKFGSS